MNIRFFEVTERSIWENFVSQYAPQSLFQSWDWGDVLETANNRFRVMRIAMGKNNEIEGAAQVIVIPSKKGKFFHLRHGPVLSEWTVAHLRMFMSNLTKIARNENIVFIRISPQIENNEKNNEMLTSIGARPSPIHAMDGEYVWVLDIDKSEDEILMNMRKTTRYLIRKAQNMNVQVDESGDIDAFISLYDRTAKRQGFIGHEGIREEYIVFKKAGNAHLYMASHNNELLSGAIVVNRGNQAIYHHGASIPSQIPASYLLQWKAIQKAKNEGLKFYNFWGIAPEENTNHPWKGLTLFKKGFGGTATEFIHAHDIALSPLYAVTYFHETIRRVKRGY